jgi:hypothetical protein
VKFQCKHVIKMVFAHLPSLKVLSSGMDPAETELKGGALKFKGLSQVGGRTDFSEILRASRFNDDISNEPTFSEIHLARLCL